MPDSAELDMHSKAGKNPGYRPGFFMRSVVVFPLVPAPAVHLFVAAFAYAEGIIPSEPVTAVLAGLDRQPGLFEELRYDAGEILLVLEDYIRLLFGPELHQERI